MPMISVVFILWILFIILTISKKKHCIGDEWKFGTYYYRCAKLVYIGSEIAAILVICGGARQDGMIHLFLEFY